MSVLFWLLVSHFALDYPLQGEAVALEKSRHSTTPLQRAVPWFYWMAAHALCHGGGVAAATGSAKLGALECVAHFAIDFGKCERWFGIHIDQLLHVLCKLLWCAIALGWFK